MRPDRLRAALLAHALAGALACLGGAATLPTVANGAPPAWIGSAKLRWAPPKLREPTVVFVPRGYFDRRFGPKEDVLLVLPGYSGPDGRRNPQTGARTSDLHTEGGLNIRLIGGDNGPGRMVFSQLVGSVFVEGVSIRLTPLKDAFDIEGAAGCAPDVYLQNIYVTGVAGSYSTVHADIVQPWGPLGDIHIDRFTGDSNYQGFFFAPAFGIRSVQISRTNLRYNRAPGDPHSFLYWFSDVPERHRPRYDVELIDVWGAARPGQAFDKTVSYPPPGVTDIDGRIGAVPREEGGVVGWPLVMRVHGEVRSGEPPQGDFAPMSIGSNYRSPGYIGPPPREQDGS